MGLLYDENCMILTSTVFDWSIRVMDKQTDRWTDGRNCRSICAHTTAYAVACKNRVYVCLGVCVCVCVCTYQHIRGFFINDMRYINSCFTYLLTYHLECVYVVVTWSEGGYCRPWHKRTLCRLTSRRGLSVCLSVWLCQMSNVNIRFIVHNLMQRISTALST